MAIEQPDLGGSDRAKNIMKASIVVDALNCVGLFRPPNWLDVALHRELVIDYWERAREAGVSAMGITCGADPDHFHASAKRMAYMSEAVHLYPDRFMLVRNSQDIREAHETGKLGIYFTNQGCVCFDENLQSVGMMKDMGMGYALIAYNNRYRTGDGAYEPDNAGLTAWGRQVIKAQIHYGMPVDVTHTGIRCTAEAIEYTQQVKAGWPVIYSHTGLKRHVDHTRAATDENALAMAATGGVINVNLCNPVVTDNPTTEVNPQDHADAIDCAIQLLGIDHVGIATDDFEEQAPFMAWAEGKHDKYPDGGRSITDVIEGKNLFAELSKCLPAIIDCLLEKGYSDQDVGKVTGGNMLRVIEQTWDIGITDTGGPITPDGGMSV